MTNEELMKAIQLVEMAVEKYIKSERKTIIRQFLEDKGDLIFSSPASSRTDYHSSFPGGLIKHSLGVFKNLKKLNQSFDCKFDEESMLIVSLFHDIGKAMTPDMKDSHYIQADDWQKQRGQNYQYNQNETFMTTHLRSIFVLQSYGINLKEDEYMAIYLNDGQYINENRPYAMKEPKLAVFLHMADLISVIEEKQNV